MRLSNLIDRADIQYTYRSISTAINFAFDSFVNFFFEKKDTSFFNLFIVAFNREKKSSYCIMYGNRPKKTKRVFIKVKIFCE